MQGFNLFLLHALTVRLIRIRRIHRSGLMKRLQQNHPLDLHNFPTQNSRQSVPSQGSELRPFLSHFSKGDTIWVPHRVLYWTWINSTPLSGSSSATSGPLSTP